MFLWDECARVTIEALQAYGCYKQQGLFDAMEKGFADLMAFWKSVYLRKG